MAPGAIRARIQVDPLRIPRELRERTQWIVWDESKEPYDAKTGTRASSTDPTTWTSFDEAFEVYTVGRWSGIGFVFTPDDPYVGIDLDACRTPETGAIDPDAQEIIDRLASYTEASPSGRGVHVYTLAGALPGTGCKRQRIEIYDKARYFTVTGRHLDGTPTAIEDRHDQVHTLYNEHKGANVPAGTLPPAEPVSLDDAAILERARGARNGSKFAALYDRGDWKGLGYPSQSEGDQALANDLAFWFGRDAQRMDTAFRSSAMMRVKWERDSYRIPTLERAIGGCADVFTLGTERPNKAPPIDSVGEPPSSNGTEESPPPQIPKPQTVGTAYRLDDAGNGQRLVAYYSDRLRYCPQWNAWVIWDGKRWRRDETDLVYEYARQTADVLFDEAKESNDDKLADALARHASKTRRHRGLADMLAQAATYQQVVVDAERLDADPMAFNVQNGTIDLRNGRRRPHRREDLITRIAPVAHDPDATAPRFERVLREVFDNDEDLVRFLQRYAGYALTGLIRDPVLLIFVGSGRNGKTTLSELLAHVWGDVDAGGGYSTVLPFGSFTQSYRSDVGPRPDLMRLRGARLVTTSEGSFGSYLDESTIKRMTGGDRMFVRGLWEKGSTFVSTAKAILHTNHRPLVRVTDTAIRARLRFVPFRVSFEGREDRSLGEKLRAEAAGVLNWALEGCRMYLANGLGSGETVDQETREYFSEMDPIQDFLDEWIAASTDGSGVPFSELCAAYRKHCEGVGIRPLSGRAFAERLSEKGIPSEKRSGQAYRVGIQLRKSVASQLPI